MLEASNLTSSKYDYQSLKLALLTLGKLYLADIILNYRKVTFHSFKVLTLIFVNTPTYPLSVGTIHSSAECLNPFFFLTILCSYPSYHNFERTPVNI